MALVFPFSLTEFYLRISQIFPVEPTIQCTYIGQTFDDFHQIPPEICSYLKATLSKVCPRGVLHLFVLKSQNIGIQDALSYRLSENEFCTDFFLRTRILAYGSFFYEFDMLHNHKADAT